MTLLAWTETVDAVVVAVVAVVVVVVVVVLLSLLPVTLSALEIPLVAASSLC
jgi:hypothetical protein